MVPAAIGRSIPAYAAGPDIIVGQVSAPVTRFGKVGDVTAYASGSVVCNSGDQQALWVGSTAQHPVLAQQLYRLKGGRFEQIGLSWAKHEFLALAEDACGFGCVPPDPYDGSQLGVGCSHPAGADLNGKQTRLGPRGQINAFTGVFPYYFMQVPYPPPGVVEINTGRRLQVHDADLDPVLNAGAAYFLELHLVARDDAAVANGINNVSYRSVIVSGNNGVYSLTLTGSTSLESSAIRAWHALDSSVLETIIDVPAEGRFILAAKASDLGSGIWHYEYALYNLNSDRSARSFLVPTPSGCVVTNIGFHDVDYHDGDSDGYAPGAIRGTDWPGTWSNDRVSWETESWDPNDRHANAVRWGTVYNFRFDADRPPVTGQVVIGLYKPGTPTLVHGATLIPQQSLGACCIVDGSCVGDTANSICSVLGATWRGTGTTCEPNLCGQPATGACCDPATGACSIATELACIAAGGTYRGDETTCDPNLCPQPPTGACCDPLEGTCTISTHSECSSGGGIYQGDESLCQPNPCEGACCHQDQSCTPSTTRAECVALAGTWRGIGTTCESGICFDPTIPAVSDWGSALLVLVFAATGVLVFRTQRRPAGSR